jgi:hypothetical protein
MRAGAGVAPRHLFSGVLSCRGSVQTLIQRLGMNGGCRIWHARPATAARPRSANSTDDVGATSEVLVRRVDVTGSLKNRESSRPWLKTTPGLPTDGGRDPREFHTDVDSGIVIHGAVSQWVCDAWGPRAQTFRDPVHNHVPGDSRLSLKLNGQ